MSFEIGTWVRLPDGTADFVWEVNADRVCVSRLGKQFYATELRELTPKETERAQADSNARFPATLQEAAPSAATMDPYTNVRPLFGPPKAERMRDLQEMQERTKETLHRLEQAERIRLARELLVAGRAITVEAAFKLADDFADEALRRLPHAFDPELITLGPLGSS